MAKAKRKPDYRPLVETYVHEYYGAVQTVRVGVRIDYRHGRISLVDTSNITKDTRLIEAKKWLFADRELEYMAAWGDILDAMKSAIADATERLKAYQETPGDNIN